MQLDGFTIVAQVVNFLILVALLKRFLYAPITRAMQAREDHITTRLDEAQEKISDAQLQAAVYDQRMQALQQTQDAMLTQAKEEAESQRQQLIEQARQEVERLQDRWRQTLRQEQTAFLQDLRQVAGQQVCAVARRVLADLADADLEWAVIQGFLARLRGLDHETRDTFSAALQGSHSDAMVRSAFPMPDEAREQILQVIHNDMLDPQIEVQFTTAPELICGIEFIAHGRKIAWSLAQHIDTLEERFAALLEQELGTEMETLAGRP
ncbi:MAG: F0F1 ATP synthase subunit B [Candidatus Tectomicrobia bacterium]|nr:F0F1 ATP synthase subunit B [Candidatus Tectomicrobia bacterium]